MKKITLLLIVLLTVAFQSRSQSNKALNNTPYQVTKITGEIDFNGSPDEVVWESIDPLKMTMLYPKFGDPPTERSEIRIAYDDEYFYLSGKLYYQNPDDIRAIGKKRDYTSFSPDWLGFTLDLFNDNKNAVIFGVNPNGARIDGTIKNDLQIDSDINFSWNTFWDAKTVRTPNGWSAEIRVPFSSLRFQSSNGKTQMGLTIMRSVAAKREVVSWPVLSPKFNNPFWKPSLTSVVEFEKLNPQNPVYFTPYVTAGFEQRNHLNDEKTAYKTTSKFKADAGLDLKYSLTNNLTADITINTDFAQVEADNQRINLTRYSLYFPEKRIFFLEKADVFDFPLLGYNNLFYSRRIGLYKGNPVRIYGGVRLTGRIGEWDIGFLDMQTADYAENPSENFGAFRTKRTIFNPYSYVGGMLTTRFGTDGSYNFAYGMDTELRVIQDDYLTLKWAQSFENEFETGFLNKDPGRFIFEWERRNLTGFSYDLIYSWSGKYFNPGIGFEVRDNFHGPQAIAKYGWLYRNKMIRYHAFSLATHKWWNSVTGEEETTSLNAKWEFESKKGANWFIAVDWSKEILAEDLKREFIIPAGKYSFTTYSGSYSTSNTKKISSNFYLNAGNYYDGRKLTFLVSPNLKIGANFEIGLFYRYDWLEFSNRNVEFTNHILRLNGLMTLTTQTALSAFVQYNTATDEVIGNFRFRYNPCDGNNFYIVYDELINTDRARKEPELPFSSRRTVLLKYNYTFRW